MGNYHVDNLVVSSFADVLLVEAQLREQLLPLAAADEGRSVHDTAVADHDAVLELV